jgi:hypothetical protein
MWNGTEQQRLDLQFHQNIALNRAVASEAAFTNRAKPVAGEMQFIQVLSFSRQPIWLSAHAK